MEYSKHSKKFKNKVAVITGAVSGNGLGIVKRAVSFEMKRINKIQ